MGNVLWVGIGGFLGAILRYLISGLVQALAPASTFPYGTLAVNVTGCFAVGVLSQLLEAHGTFGPAGRAFLFVGLLGGYTTFSTFGNETANLALDGQRLGAWLNVGAHVLVALGAVWLGRLAAQTVWR